MVFLSWTPGLTLLETRTVEPEAFLSFPQTTTRGQSRTTYDSGAIAEA